jgi:hypothetical protein
MMSRDIMQRQMFAKGGAAFPDMSGDGRVTQKDILMGRGVIPMQEGGMAPMMPPQNPADIVNPMDAAQAMDPAILQGLLQQAQDNLGNLDDAEDYATVINSLRGDDAPIEARYAELAELVGPEDAQQTPESVLTLVQPAIMMAAVDQGIGGLAAEEMTAPVEGAMAEGIMSTVAPPPPPEMMAAPPAAPGPMMDPAMMGGPPPVNFNQGGLVRRGDNQPVQYFEDAGVVLPPSSGFFSLRDRPFTTGTDTPTLDTLLLQNIAKAQNQAAARRALSPAAAANLPPIKSERGDGDRLRELVEAQRGLYREYGLGDPEARAADLEEQKNMTQAQMLFDIANTALAFAAPMEGERRGMSPAERLAMAARTTQLPQTIGARAQQQLEYKRAAEKEGRTMDLAALQSAETKLAAEIASEDALAVARLKRTDKAAKPMKLVVPGKPDRFFNAADPDEYDTYAAAAIEEGGDIFEVGTDKKDKSDRVNVVKPTTGGGEKVVGSFDLNIPADKTAYDALLASDKTLYPITASPRVAKENTVVLYNEASGTQSPSFDKNSPEGQKAMAAWVTNNPLPMGQQYKEKRMPTAPTSDRPISERDIFQKTGFSISELNQMTPEDRMAVRTDAFLSAKDFFMKMSMTQEQFKTLTDDQKAEKMGLTVITDRDYLMKYGVPSKAQFLSYSPEIQNRLMKITPEPKVMKDARGRLIDVSNPDAPKIVVDTETPIKPSLMKATIDGEQLYVDINSASFDAVQKRVNTALANGKNATLTMVTSEIAPKGFLIDGAMRLSYDNGKTYVDLDGKSKPVPPDSIIVSSETSYNVLKQEKARRIAGQKLAEFDNMLVSSLVGQDGVDSADLLAVKDAMAMARKGTGFYSIFTAFLDGASSLVPSVIKPNWLEVFGRETQQARQYLRGIRVLGRSALVVNPRFPVAEMSTVGALFPSPEAFLVDPDSEAQKFIELKRIAMQQYQNNLRQLSSGTLDAALVQQVQANNFELQRLMNLLPGVPLGVDGELLDPQAQQEAQSIISGAIQRGGTDGGGY